MASLTSKSVTLAVLAAASGLGIVAGPASAQSANPAYGQLKEDPGADLSRHLRTLADEPRSLSALTGAGKAALALGDPQAAATFYARAEEIAPRDGRIKAGIGSAFVQMEQAAAALNFFGQATSLGVPDAEIAADRGLAYDLTGNPARAQLDYALALRRGSDPEVQRRLALSQAIGGDRAGALKTIDAQLRQQDRAAWRTRAFILALTGDAVGATEAAKAVMPAQAGAMRPFFAKLPSLALADRAMAVHFGHFPGDGQAMQMASADPPVSSRPAPAVTDAGRPDRGQTSLARRTSVPEPVATGPRRRPGAEVATTDLVNTRIPGTRPQSASSPVRETIPALQQQAKVTAPGIRTAGATPSVARPAATAPDTTNPSMPAAKPALTATLPDRAPVRTAPTTIASGDVAPSAVASPPAPEPTPARRSSFAEVAASIAALPGGAVPARATSPPATKPAQLARADVKTPDAVKPAETVKTDEARKEPAKKAPAKKAAVEKKAEPKDPSRHWVQIAGGADKALMGQEYKRLKGKAPKLFAAQTGWTTPLNATNRLLVGPFKTEKEAQAFVNELAKADLSAFSWTSPAGQEIEKLAAK